MTISQTLIELITVYIIPNSQKVNRAEFRKMLISDQMVSEILVKNNDVLQQAFNYFVSAKKKTVSLEECVALARQC